MVPTLDLNGIEHDTVENEVRNFLSLWMGKHLFTYFIVGDNEALSEVVLRTATDQGLECMTGMPGYPGKIRVVML